MRIRDSVHSDRFPDSYYRATCNDLEPFRRLEGNIQVDVCIVGGGLSGVATALHLAEQGVDVALLEQNRIGWGASGRNGGQLLGGYGPELSDIDKIQKVFGSKHADAAFQMGIECMDIATNWIEKYDIECDLKWGYFDAAMNQGEMDELEEAAEALHSKGYPHELEIVKQDNLHSVIKSDRFIGGLKNMGWAHIHPLNLVRAEARAAEKLGARIYEDARVNNIEYGDTCVVDTGYARITANTVVLCGNAYLGDLVPKLAARVIPAGSYIIATEPLGDLADEIMAGDCAVCDLRWALDYFRLSADKRMLFGGLATYSGKHPKSIKGRIMPNMLKVFPELKDVKIDYEWGGYIGIGLNRIPQVGKLQDNVYFAQAYSGHGVAQTHMSGKVISEAILGDRTKFDVIGNVFHPPFPGGRYLRQPILAAGMAFYKLRDELGI